MDKNTLFAKTVAGREALATRSAGLGPRLRSLLIMVDGKRSLAELDKLTGGLGTAEGLLTDLLAAGFIEVVGVDGLPKAAAAPAAEPIAPAPDDASAKASSA